MMAMRGAPLRARSGSPSRGFTLVELLVAVGVLAALLSLAAPALRQLMLNQRTKSAAAEAYYTLVYARSEAIKRSAPVEIAARDGDFGRGWDIKLGGKVLLSHQGPAKVEVAGPATSTLVYRRDGRLATPGTVELVFTPAGNPGVATRCIHIDVTGRPAVLTDASCGKG